MTDYQDEQWKPCIDGDYAISNCGRFKRLTPGRRTYPGFMHSPNLMKIGYYCVRPVINGKNVLFTIHSLVAEHFIGPRPEGMEVNHIDGNKTNNHVSNLEYVTHRENLLHAIRIGLVNRENQRVHDRDKVDAVRADRAIGMSFQKIADKHGIGLSTAYQYCSGRYGAAAGLPDMMGERQKPKLTEEDVVRMRHKRAAGASCASCAELAREFGVGETTVSNICIGRKWKKAGGPLFRSRGVA